MKLEKQMEKNQRQMNSLKSKPFLEKHLDISLLRFLEKSCYSHHPS